MATPYGTYITYEGKTAYVTLTQVKMDLSTTEKARKECPPTASKVLKFLEDPSRRRCHMTSYNLRKRLKLKRIEMGKAIRHLLKKCLLKVFVGKKGRNVYKLFFEIEPEIKIRKPAKRQREFLLQEKIPENSCSIGNIAIRSVSGWKPVNFHHTQCSSRMVNRNGKEWKLVSLTSGILQHHVARWTGNYIHSQFQSEQARNVVMEPEKFLQHLLHRADEAVGRCHRGWQDGWEGCSAVLFLDTESGKFVSRVGNCCVYTLKGHGHKEESGRSWTMSMRNQPSSELPDRIRSWTSAGMCLGAPNEPRLKTMKTFDVQRISTTDGYRGVALVASSSYPGDMQQGNDEDIIKYVVGHVRANAPMERSSDDSCTVIRIDL